MYLVIITNLLIWLFIGLVLATQVILPMFTDYKFFWIFTYWEIKKKYKNKLNDVTKKAMEKEIKKSIKRV